VARKQLTIGKKIVDSDSKQLPSLPHPNSTRLNNFLI